jgi:Domain of unknown function (DUF1937)
MNEHVSIAYIAGPYSNDAPANRSRNASAEKRIARFNAVTELARCMIENGELIYSPLTMTHPIDIRMKHDPGSAFWVTFDEAFMVHCDRIIVLKLPGWDESSGVNREIKFFSEMGIEAQYVDPNAYGIDPSHPDFSAAFG